MAIFGEPTPLRKADAVGDVSLWDSPPDEQVDREVSPGWVRLRLMLPLTVSPADADEWAADLLTWSSRLPLGLRVFLSTSSGYGLTVDLPGLPHSDLVRAFEGLLVGYRDWLLGALDTPPSPRFASVDDAKWRAVAKGVEDATKSREWPAKSPELHVSPGYLLLEPQGRPSILIRRDGPEVVIRQTFPVDWPVSESAWLQLHAGLVGVALARDPSGGLHLRAAFPGGHLSRTDVEAMAAEFFTVAAELPSQPQFVQQACPSLLVGADS
jgi:hypothetical protein